MSDIDFDELDKAVNTLMAGVDTTKRNTALDDPEDKVVALETKDESTNDTNSNAAPSVTTSQDISHIDALPEGPAAEAVNQSTVAPSLATKRRGQFMDMIHPSSDMKSVQKPVKRQGVTIASSEGSIEPLSASVQTPANEEPVTPAVASEAEVVNEPAPLISPFLPDAKPEKRPLGSPIIGAPVEQSSEATADTEDTAIENQVPIEASQQILPAELHSDVLAVESNDLSTTIDEQEESTPTPTESTPTATTQELPIENIEQPAPEVVAIAEPTEPSVEPAPEASGEVVLNNVPAGGSISQQYAETPSSGDQTSGSIYDTANYHQPIETTNPPKKKGSLKWIVLAVGLLLVGGGVGVGYFLLTH